MKCIQQVSAQRENMQPHPKRVADVMTKLLFACYTNHYTASEAKAPLAVVAVRRNQHQELNLAINVVTHPVQESASTLHHVIKDKYWNAFSRLGAWDTDANIPRGLHFTLGIAMPLQDSWKHPAFEKFPVQSLKSAASSVPFSFFVMLQFSHQNYTRRFGVQKSLPSCSFHAQHSVTLLTPLWKQPKWFSCWGKGTVLTTTVFCMSFLITLGLQTGMVSLSGIPEQNVKLFGFIVNKLHQFTENTQVWKGRVWTRGPAYQESQTFLTFFGGGGGNTVLLAQSESDSSFWSIARDFLHCALKITGRKAVVPVYIWTAWKVVAFCDTLLTLWTALRGRITDQWTCPSLALSFQGELQSPSLLQGGGWHYRMQGN